MRIKHIYLVATYTSTLPDPLMEQLSKKAKELCVPKNKIIEKALKLYLLQINKAEYIKSYKRLNQDTDILQLAEEGLSDYFDQINRD